jgi:hypothetical protein
VGQRNGIGIVGGVVKQYDPEDFPWIVNQEALALQFDSSASPILYLGQAQPGSSTSAALWQIMRIDTSSGVAITYANGSGDYTNIWNDRASLPYS